MWTADDVVDPVFLIYLKYIDNSVLYIRFKCSSTLFIQWVKFGQSGSPIKMIFPIAFTKNQYAAAGADNNQDNNGCVLNFYNKNPEYCMISGKRIGGKTSTGMDAYGTGIFVGW